MQESNSLSFVLVGGIHQFIIPHIIDGIIDGVVSKMAPVSLAFWDSCRCVIPSPQLGVSQTFWFSSNEQNTGERLCVTSDTRSHKDVACSLWGKLAALFELFHGKSMWHGTNASSQIHQQPQEHTSELGSRSSSSELLSVVLANTWTVALWPPRQRHLAKVCPLTSPTANVR